MYPALATVTRPRYLANFNPWGLFMNPWVRSPQRPLAVTRIERLVVVAILAILAGLLLPAVNLVKANAVNSTCQSQQRQVMATSRAVVTR